MLFLFSFNQFCKQAMLFEFSVSFLLKGFIFIKVHFRTNFHCFFLFQFQSTAITLCQKDRGPKLLHQSQLSKRHPRKEDRTSAQSFSLRSIFMSLGHLEINTGSLSRNILFRGSMRRQMMDGSQLRNPCSLSLILSSPK